MKVLISADMEGATGVTFPDDCEPGHPRWEYCRRLLTGDVNAAVTRAKDPNDDFRLSGFGPRVYKTYDPRARILRQTAERVLADLDAKDSLFDIALELEHVALTDEYFIEKKLYPNVDFYSGLIYEAMRFPIPMFTVLFAIARTSGWLAQWVEMLNDAADRMLLVTEREIAAAVAAFDAAGIRTEAAAGAGLAALPQLADVDGPVVLIVTGANIDDGLLARCRDDIQSFPAG